MIRAAALIAACLVTPAAACPWPAAELGGVQNMHTRRLETALGEPLADRMRRLKVPGVGVAVLRGGQVAWARGWGVAAADRCTPVTARTAFQAASISKTLFALTVVTLAERGVLDLDTDVARYLRSWTAPAGVTLRALLGHTAGFGGHGFPGYPVGAPLPTLPQILTGTPPANTPPVRIDAVPGTFAYSGGGYEVAELALTDALGPYPALAQATVLDPLGMADSGFAAPAGAARGHAGGRVVAGGWHVYPEAAAAGLWSTPAELARLLGALTGTAAQAMTVRTSPGYGLGLEIAGEGASLRFGHRGSNAGYRALALVFAATGDGLVVMTNGEEGDALAAGIAAALATDYGWPASGF